MSNHVFVRFSGICTHVLGGIGGNRRIVFVRADHGANILGKPIPPHIPKLRIEEEDIAGYEGTLDGLTRLGPGLWQLAGVDLQLDGVAPGRYKPDESYELKVPHLCSAAGKLDPPAHDVVQYERAAGYFNVYDGRLSATELEGGAVVTDLVANVAGQASLQITCFWNRKTSKILLHPGAQIHLEHIGSGTGDTEHDFLLHYLVFPSIPDDVVCPKEDKKARRGNDISAGCSNSQYP